jgi:hypothetical protein
LIIEALIALIAPEKPEAPINKEGSTPEFNIGSVFIAYRAKLDEDEKKVVTAVNLTQVCQVCAMSCHSPLTRCNLSSTGDSTSRLVYERTPLWLM